MEFPGLLVSRNITSSKTKGVGGWMNAYQAGSISSRWAFRMMTDGELHDIIAYHYTRRRSDLPLTCGLIVG